MLFLICILITQTLSQLCSKNLEESFELSAPNTYLRITYQLQDKAIVDINNIIVVDVISIEKERISFSYTNNYFQIYVNNQQVMDNLYLSPGQYLSYEIFCTDYQRNACKFNTKIYRWNEIQFKICLDQDYVEYINQEIVTQDYLSLFIIQNIDNTFFHTSLWIKEIVQGNLPIQIIFSQPQGCIFEFNFKTKRIIYCNQRTESELIVKESLYFNIWFYFEFNQFQYRQEFNNFFVLGQFQIEQTQSFNTQINYSFENKLQLDYPNSIISSLKIKQSYQDDIQIDLCIPDCNLCEQGLCIQCKSDMILEQALCYCSNINQVSDRDGICQHPAQFLKLQEKQSISKCNFGYYYSNIILECVKCPFENKLPEINCLLGLSQKETDNKIKLKSNFQQKFESELKKVVQYKCPKNCLSCVVIVKTIQCLICKQGQLDYKGLCQQCKTKHCQYCFTLVRETCSVCFELYSLNSESQCIQSKEYQFDKLLQHLQKIFVQGDEKCQLYGSNGCILCLKGLSIQNGICIKSQQINIIYYSSSIFAKDPLIAFGQNQQGNFYFLNLVLLNQQKLYFEQSIKSKIYFDQQLSDIFTPSYYNKDINNYSFCRKFPDCDNYLEIDVKIIKTENGMNLVFQQILFQNINQILIKLQLYDISLKFVQINIYSDLSLFIGINLFSQMLKLDPQNSQNVKLFYFGGNIFNDFFLSENALQLDILSSQTIHINDVNLINDHSQQLIINFDNDEILIKNVNIQGNIQFQFQNQSKVTIQLLKLSQNYINTEFIFKFLYTNVQIILENIYIYDLRLTNTTIFFIQSTITSLIFNNSIFYNITLYSSSIFYQGFNSQMCMQDWCNSQIVLDDLEFNELKLDNSQLFYSHLAYFSIINQVFIKNNIITKCMLIDSHLYQFVGQYYKIFKIDTIFISHIQSQNSNIFNINYQPENQLILTNISIINCKIKNNFLIFISAANQVLIKGLFIQQLVLQSLQYTVIVVMTKNAYVRNFNLTNLQGNILAKSFILISAKDIQVNNFVLFCNSISQINLYRVIFLQTSSQINLINMNISNINFFGDSFFTIQSTNQSIIMMKEFDIRVNFISHQQLIVENDQQMLIQFQSQQNNQVYAKDFNINLNYQESMQLSRCAIYSTGQSNIKLHNLTFNILDNGQIPNSLIYIEGNVIEITNNYIKYKSYNLNRVNQSNTIFRLICKILNIQSIQLDINASQIGVIHLQQNIYSGDIIQINNITLLSGSLINSFLTARSILYNLIVLQNIQIVASINANVISIFCPQSTMLIIKNMTLIQQNQKIINAISIDGQSTLVNLFNVHLSKIYTKQVDLQYTEVYLRFFVKQLCLDNFIINQLDQPAVKIVANNVVLKNVMIQNVTSTQDIIFIGESSRILMRDIFILQSQSFRSIISIGHSYCKQLYLRNLLFRENDVQNGNLILLEIGEQRHYSNFLKTIVIVLSNMKSINNICHICYKFVNNMAFNISQQIRNTIHVDYYYYVLLSEGTIKQINFFPM